MNRRKLITTAILTIIGLACIISVWNFKNSDSGKRSESGPVIGISSVLGEK